MTIYSGPSRDGICGLGAIEINDQLLAGVQMLHRILGLDQRKWAHRAERIEGVATRFDNT